MKSHVQRRAQKAETGESLDWATAEAMAFGSLVAQGKSPIQTVSPMSGILME